MNMSISDKNLFEQLLAIRKTYQDHFLLNPNYFLSFSKPSPEIMKRYCNFNIGEKYLKRAIFEIVKNLLGYFTYSIETRSRQKLAGSYEYIFISHITNRNFIEPSDPYFDFIIERIPESKKILIIYLNGSKFINFIAEKKITKKFTKNVTVHVVSKYPSLKVLTEHISRGFRGTLNLLKSKQGHLDKCEYEFLTMATLANFQRETLSNLSIRETFQNCLSYQVNSRIFTTIEGNLFESFLVYFSDNNQGNKYHFYQHTPVMTTQYGLQDHVSNFNHNCILLTTGSLTSEHLNRYLPNKSIKSIIVGSKKAIPISNFPSPENNKVLFVPEGTSEAITEMWFAAKSLAPSNPRIEFSVRVHPSIFKSEFRKLNLHSKDSNLKFSKSSLKEDLSNSKFCVYRSSAVGVEATLANLVPIYYSTSPHNLDILELTSIIHPITTRIDELDKTLKNLEHENYDNTELRNICTHYFEPLNYKSIQSLI